VGRVEVDNQGLRLWCDVRNRRQKLKGEDIVVKDRALEFDQSSSGTKKAGYGLRVPRGRAGF
jgi:hypothetical protein